MVTPFHDDVGTKAERLAGQELETFLRYAILGGNRWRPATSTSAIITLPQKDGISRRYWVNGTLFGLKYTNGKIKEMALQVERYPRFPTLNSVEEYVRTRLPYQIMSQSEIQCIARQIDKRFLLVGRTEVYDFQLQRKVRWERSHKADYSAITLRWQIPRESWGFCTWKAYFLLCYNGKVRFLSSRVSCHVYMDTWFRERLPLPWKYGAMEKPRSPPVEHPAVPRALNWVMMCWDVLLKQKSVIASLEDDPISGMPEDVRDGIDSIDEVRKYFKFRPPEELNGISRSLTESNFHREGYPAECNYRLEACAFRGCGLYCRNTIRNYCRPELAPSKRNA